MGCLVTRSMRLWPPAATMVTSPVFHTGPAPLPSTAVVEAVEQGEGGVTVSTADGANFTAQYAVLTPSLGVLKAHAIAFDPPLPPAKLAAIEDMGFGLLDKLVLVFPAPFWDTSGARAGAPACLPACGGHEYLRRGRQATGARSSPPPHACLHTHPARLPPRTCCSRLYSARDARLERPLQRVAQLPQAVWLAGARGH